MDWKKLSEQTLSACIATFSEAIQYLPRSGASFGVLAIFDDAGHLVEEAGVSVVSTQPKICVRLSDFPVVPGSGDRVQIRGVIYRVQDYLPDGQGGATLTLHKV